MTFYSAMVNAWSLAYEVLYGNMDEVYPIMTDEKKKVEVTVNDTPAPRNYEGPLYAQHPDLAKKNDQDFWEYDGHSVVGNPMAGASAPDTIHIDTSGLTTGSTEVTTFGAAEPVQLDLDTYGTDSLSFSTADEGSDWVARHGGYEWTPGTSWPPKDDITFDEPAPFAADPLSDNDDQIAHHIPTTPEVFGNDYTMDQLEADKKYQDAMMPGIEEDHRKWIYESPDGGKTVYRRTHGQDPMTRELVPQKDSQAGVRHHSLADADMRDHIGTEYKMNSFKYNEDKTLKEIKEYVASTYRSHYANDNKTQTLDLIDSIGDAEAFSKANAIKYLSRFGKKDGKSKFDILKAIHYCILLYHFSGLHNDNENPYETF